MFLFTDHHPSTFGIVAPAPVRAITIATVRVTGSNHRRFIRLPRRVQRLNVAMVRTVSASRAGVPIRGTVA
jgi:hypothetical protein